MESLWREYKADVRRTFLRPPTTFWIAFGPILHAGLRAVLIYRIAHRFYRVRALRFVSSILKRIAFAVSGAEIHPSARFGPGLHLPHPLGIVIGPGVTADGEATIFQGVVLGPRGSDPTKVPHLGLHTFVYPGALVLGDVDVGPRTQIGANVVVMRSLPAGTTVLPPEPIILERLSFGLRFESPSEVSQEAEAVK